MNGLKKILISSITLIIIGITGLVVISFVASSGLEITNFGAGQGYRFCSEDISHMSRGWKTEATEELTFSKVRKLTKSYLEKNNIDNLEIAEIMEFSRNFYIELEEKDSGIGAMELLVDKSSGAVFSEYGPNMMWNLKYGIHQSIPLTRDNIEMTISEEKALELAESYLLKTNKGEEVSEEAEKFYGYYTIHTLTADGKIAGMLSVNGFSGQVWHHNWHGLFIDMVEDH